MASPAQILANRANAAHSTGPSTPAGKARSSRNATRHGLTAGIFQQDEAFADAVFAEMQPAGALELELFNQFVDAALRLRRIRALTRELFARVQTDPIVHPDTEADMRQLTRYRAHAEMSLFRALKTLRQMQQQRLTRTTQIREIEANALPPLADPAPHKHFEVDGHRMNAIDRAVWHHFWQIQREAKKTETNPIPITPPGIPA